jgi:endonuclease/exonuclease/phosphatase family metal-dependent hydrolase
MSRTAIVVLALLALASFGPCPVCADEFVIASWNLENLFDTADDPKVALDEDFTPQSQKRWTGERLDIKLNNLSGVIRKMKDGRGPDVLGLCEVENRKVTEMLIEKLQPLGRKYEIIHKDSPSERGIDCAIVFDRAVFSLADSEFHHVDAGKTRDIVEAKLRRNDQDLYVFMDHWPSRHHEPPARKKAGDTLRKRIDEILAADANADIVLLGDFNDESTDESIRDHLRAASTAENLPAGTLFDTTAAIRAAGKGTFVYKNKWDLLDHIIISPGLLNQGGFRWKEGSSQRLEYPELFYQPNYPDAINRPSASYTKNDFHKNGVSDHLPLNCVIIQ